MSTVSAAEQLLLELINRARLDPLGEAARYGISLNQGVPFDEAISHDPKQPLAHNAILADASDLHSTWMLATNTFSHTGSGNSDPGDRMRDAGYEFTGSWAWGENLSWRGSIFSLDPNAVVYRQHEDLFLSAGHRANTMNDAFAEIGIGQIIGDYTYTGEVYETSMVTEKFAASGGKVFVTGVVYDDTSGDDFYSVGEGRGGIAVSAGGTGTASAAAGGYAIEVTGATAAVAFGSGPSAIAAQVTLGGKNAKVDLVDGDTLLTSSNLVLGANAVNAGALGSGKINLIGNAEDNGLKGGSGNNFLFGGAGDDVLDGGAGMDFLWSAAGADTVTGGAGFDFFVFSDMLAGADTLTDFTSGEDFLLLFMGRPPGSSASIAGTGMFQSGDGLPAYLGATPTPQLYFDTATSELYLDFDSGMTSNALLIADLNGAMLEETDVFIF